ncbi:MAG: 2-amino-4-hydroxy-6-hydroxymethyldihydropteridine diphosphokinase [Candidatus Omnitrophica bacterium]|nr:2-amino-4-hydroxy-6-hydroxymethyldihydropteridine diphosphokinase [Candidatus Omnitrophota bacterium]
MVTCFLGIGSNLGDRRKNIKRAVGQINALRETKVVKLSSIIETLPQGVTRQPKFLNAAARIVTSLPPPKLLKELKDIERKLGRTAGVRWGPRPIDLDILFYGDSIVRDKVLEIPHPGIKKRDFVRRPLLEII